MYYDVFNGDADGLCALIQLRLAEPRNSTLITGVKRDIQLLEGLSAGEGDILTVLDISLQKNSKAVKQLLHRGAHIFYVDHHQAGDIPEHPHFRHLINTDSNQCTSLLVNGFLKQQFPLWAMTAAFGDNMTQAAEAIARQQSLQDKDLILLRNLGVYLNYNSYGESLADLHFAPAELYQWLIPYASPLDFIQDNTAVFQQLQAGYLNDMASATALSPSFENTHVVVMILPDVAWARRVQGVFGNAVANATPEKAHAILTPVGATGYQVSVRAPLTNKTQADVLCANFPSGGGRQGAAGINFLPRAQLENFVQKFSATYATANNAL